MVSDGAPIPAMVVIVGSAVVGRALELLLSGGGCHVRFLPDSSLREPDLLNRAKLLLLAPGLSTERREALLALVSSMPSVSRIPVLELANNSQEAQGGVGNLVPWPCRTKELKRRIDAALLAK